jgi:hypothetical protein
MSMDDTGAQYVEVTFEATIVVTRAEIFDADGAAQAVQNAIGRTGAAVRTALSTRKITPAGLGGGA